MSRSPQLTKQRHSPHAGSLLLGPRSPSPTTLPRSSPETGNGPPCQIPALCKNAKTANQSMLCIGCFWLGKMNGFDMIRVKKDGLASRLDQLYNMTVYFFEEPGFEGGFTQIEHDQTILEFFKLLFQVPR